jgi:hypothetical protein
MAQKRVDDWLAAARAEVERLRRALIAAGKASGAGLSDAVSTDFLMSVPQEVTMVVSKLRSEADAAIRELAAAKQTSARLQACIDAIGDHRDAAIRDRNEFAAREVERFMADNDDPDHPFWDLSFDEALRRRAAELRAGAVPATEPKLSHAEQCAKDVAAWPEWKRKAAAASYVVTGGRDPEATEPKPEPAAEVGAFDAAILAAKKHASAWGTDSDRIIITAVEALAREVRAERSGGAS